ncbi:MAG: phage terminase large subunit [Nitrosospira sp.]|nr:phage terminase large subunit [Nitrosospira sp.]
MWEWFTGTLPTRAANPDNFHKMIVMQRLTENDLCGRIEEITKKDPRAEHYEVLRLPMRFEVDRKCTTMVGGDRRTTDGELLWPERFSEESVARIESALRAVGGEQNVGGQMQQSPQGSTGNQFKKEWIQHWGVPGSKYTTLPPAIESFYMSSWDCTFRGSNEGKGKVDYVVGQIWQIWRNQYAFLLDQYRGQWSFTETIDAFEASCKKWPKAWRKLVENKANGPAVCNVLSARIPGIELVNPQGGKEVRANAVEPVFRALAVFLPPLDTKNDEGEIWVPDYIREILTFPGARNDDQVDCTTQALLEIATTYTAEQTALLTDAFRNFRL